MSCCGLFCQWQDKMRSCAEYVGSRQWSQSCSHPQTDGEASRRVCTLCSL